MTVNNNSERTIFPIRVLVANMSGVMFEIVIRAIQQQPDMTLTHYAKDSVELAEAVGDQTDVLIVGAPYIYPPPTICHDLWLSFPALKIFVLTPSGDSALVYWLSIRQHRLKTVSVGTLLGTIRTVHQFEWTGG
jgi:hypothetical protein